MSNAILFLLIVLYKISFLFLKKLYFFFSHQNILATKPLTCFFSAPIIFHRIDMVGFFYLPIISKFIKGEMQMMKNLKFHKIVMATKRKWIPALPTIFVSIFLFLTILPLFGIQYVIMCSFLALLFRTKHLQDFRPRALAKTGIIMLLLCFFAFLATRNLALCILLNFFVPFFITGLLTNKFNPKAYFVYGMEFVFLQLMPIKLD